MAKEHQHSTWGWGGEGLGGRRGGGGFTVTPPRTHLAGGAEALLQLNAVGFVLHLTAEVEVGDVPQQQRGAGDGQHTAAHG